MVTWLLQSCAAAVDIYSLDALVYEVRVVALLV